MKNMTPFEAVVASKLIEQGYEVLASGWPDFCVVKTIGDTTEIRFIEVKGRGDALRPSQQKLHKILRVLGLEVEVIQEDAEHRMQYPPSLASGVRVVRRHLGGRPPIAAQKAIPFLIAELSDGPKKVRDIFRKAKAAGISRSTLYRVAKDKQVINSFQSEGIIWELPVQQVEEPKS
jgi:hypothetical protein